MIKEIGVDIEKVLPFDLKIANGLFTEEEYKNLLNKKEEKSFFFL
jgi:phosphopantetheinyl transferase